MQQQIREATTTLREIDSIVNMIPRLVDDRLANFLATYPCVVNGSECEGVIPVLKRLFEYIRTYDCKTAAMQVVPFCIRMIACASPVTIAYQVLINIFSVAIRCDEPDYVAGLISQNAVWLYDRGQLGMTIIEIVCEYGSANVSSVVYRTLAERHALTGVLANVVWHKVHRTAYDRPVSHTHVHITMVVFADIIRLEHIVSNDCISEWDGVIRGHITRQIRAYNCMMGMRVRDSDRSRTYASTTEVERSEPKRSRISSKADDESRKDRGKRRLTRNAESRESKRTHGPSCCDIKKEPDEVIDDKDDVDDIPELA
jgi:hypothetical protein